MKKITLLFIFLMLLFIPEIHSQAKYHLNSYTVEISGTSNLHDWTAKITDMTLIGSLSVLNGELLEIQSLDVAIDANTIESSGGSIMDSKMKDALKSKNNPKIEYSLVSVKLLTKTSTGYRIETSGTLKIGGELQPVEIQADGKFLPNGELEFSGSKKLKMTSYKLTPPTAMFGTLKTGDEVDVAFKFTVNQ